MSYWLIVLLAGLGMIGSLGIDTYLPAFPTLIDHFHAAPLILQQSLTGYLLGMALMMLFYGTLSDCFGRRRVILCSLAVFAGGSFAAAASHSIDAFIAWRTLQGLAAGAGSVVGRAIIQDRSEGAAALKAMSQVIMAFALAPALAPLVGAWLLSWAGWRSIFIFLGVFSALLWLACWIWLTESLPPARRQGLAVRPLLRRYTTVMADPQFLLLTIAAGLGFSVFSLYIGAAAPFVTETLKRGSDGFGWLFVPLVSGMISGSWLGARLAHHIDGTGLIALGYTIQTASTVAAALYFNLTEAQLPWAVLPLGAATFGLALINPGLALAAMGRFPNHRGLASSLNGFINTLFFAAFAGIIAPLLSGDPRRLAAACLLSVLVSGLCWQISKHLRSAHDGGSA